MSEPKHYQKQKRTGDAATPPSCKPRVPIFPTRIALSKKTSSLSEIVTKLGLDDIVSPYTVESISGYTTSLRLLRGDRPNGDKDSTKGGHLYVYDSTTTLYHHYIINEQGLIAYAPWEKNSKNKYVYNSDGIRKYTEQLPYRAYILLPANSGDCYFFYTPGDWSDDMHDRFKADAGGSIIRDKVGVKVNIKAWLTSKKAPMTFVVDETLHYKIDDLHNADLQFSSWPPRDDKGQVSTKFKPIHPKGENIFKEMRTHTKTLVNMGVCIDDTACMGIALYDPVGIAEDLSHLVSFKLAKIKKIQDTRKYVVGRFIEDIYTAKLNPDQLSKLETMNSVESRKYRSKEGGDDKWVAKSVIEQVRDEERQKYLNKADAEVEKIELEIELLAPIHVHVVFDTGKGTLKSLANFYGTETRQLIEDLRAIISTSITGLPLSKAGTIAITKEAATDLPMPTENNKDGNMFIKALDPPEINKGLDVKPQLYNVDLTTPQAGAAIGATDLVANGKIDKISASTTSAALWTDVVTAIQRAHAEQWIKTQNYFTVERYAIRLAAISHGIRLEHRSTTLGKALAEFGHNVSKIYNLAQANTVVKLYYIESALKVLKTAGVHVAILSGARIGFAGLGLWVSAYNINKIWKELNYQNKKTFINYLTLGKEIGLGGAVATGTGSYIAGRAGYWGWSKGAGLSRSLAITSMRFNVLGIFSVTVQEKLKLFTASNKKEFKFRLGAALVFSATLYVAVTSSATAASATSVAGALAALGPAGWVVLAGIFVGSMLSAMADSYDPNTLEGWAFKSIWGKEQKDDRFKTADEEREAFYQVMYTPNFTLKKRPARSGHGKELVAQIAFHLQGDCTKNI